MASRGQKQTNLPENTNISLSDQLLAARVQRIEQILEDQYSILKEVRQDAEKARRYILWGRVMSLIYLLVVILPIILAAIYLPPYVRKFTAIFGAPEQHNSDTAAPFRDVRQLLQELKQGY